MKSAVIDQPTLVPEPEAPSTALAPPADNLVLMFERLAKDPAVDVEKLRQLIDMQERILAHNAKAEFSAAFAEMQGEIPIITKRGEIEVNNQVRSTFARHEDIQRVIRPILQKHGFAIRHRNEFTQDKQLKIIGILSHRSGHSEQDEFVGPADTSGSKNAIQALGSTRSYGMRYTTIALLNITTEEQDDDGETSEQFKAPDAPDGYAKWWTSMEAAAERGMNILTTGWNDAPKEYRLYAQQHDRSKWQALRNKAAQVKP
jgi:hypothetical protein